MDGYGNFDLLGEEFEFLSLPNYRVFKEHNDSKPLEAGKVADEQTKVAGIGQESETRAFSRETFRGKAIPREDETREYNFVHNN